MVDGLPAPNPGSDLPAGSARGDDAYSVAACTVFGEIEAIVRTSGADELREIGERMQGAEGTAEISSATGLSEAAADLIPDLEEHEQLATAFLIGAFLQDHHPHLLEEALTRGPLTDVLGGGEGFGLDNPFLPIVLDGARESYRASCVSGSAVYTSEDGRQAPGQAAADEWRGAELTEAEVEVFQSSVHACWNIDPASPAASVSMIVEFSLDRHGRVEPGSIRQASAEGPAEAYPDAFERARRAVLRCERGGYSLPEEKFEQWRTMSLPFDPALMK